jgi:hypothetical protein
MQKMNSRQAIIHKERETYMKARFKTVAVCLVLFLLVNSMPADLIFAEDHSAVVQETEQPSDSELQEAADTEQTETVSETSEAESQTEIFRGG